MAVTIVEFGINFVYLHLDYLKKEGGVTGHATGQVDVPVTPVRMPSASSVQKGAGRFRATNTACPCLLILSKVQSLPNASTSLGSRAYRPRGTSFSPTVAIS